jgi:CHAT domain-containing protein
MLGQGGKSEIAWRFRCGNRQVALQIAATLLVAFVVGSCPAAALTLEQARENCRATVGRPIVQACRQGGRGDLEACRALASPKVRACVQSALNAANGRANVPVAIPTQPAPRPAADAPAGQAAAFVAPPRTIADITAILDSEKPDAAKIEELKVAADEAPPAGASRADLAQFYYDRGNARGQLGRLSEAIGDANKAIATGQGAIDANMMGRLLQFAGLQYTAAGDLKQAFAVFSRQVRDTNTPGAKGYQFGGYRQLSAVLIQMGDVAQAEAFLRRGQVLIQEARTSGMPGWRRSYGKVGQAWEADVELNRAIIFEARGQFRDAENSYRLAELRRRASIPGVLSLDNPPPESQIHQAADAMVLGQARMKARQGRRAEAEVDARRALLARLKEQGKYNPMTPRYIMGLADILVEQGRYGEAEKLARVSLEINRAVGVAEVSQSTAQLLSSLAGILNLQRRPQAAMDVYAELDRAIAGWDPRRRERFELNASRISSLYVSGNVEAGLSAARELLKREIARVGEQHFDTAAARGLLAVGYVRAGREADALREFRIAIPILAAAARENADDDDTTVVAARSGRLQDIVEVYIGLLARQQGEAAAAAATESFRLADMIRSRSVQQALVSSSARAIAADPSLAELVRHEQDLVKQINAQLGLLNNVLAQPSAERDEKGVAAINAAIGRARAEREQARAEIGRRFPDYANLIDPKPATVAAVRDALHPGEALLSFYFGRDRSFVWAVPKDGPIAFAPVGASAGEIETKVRQLREALEPQAETVFDIPPFDLDLAYDLYSLLLAPVEAGWKPARSIIVVTNGALGLLPLSLLPTGPAQAPRDAAPLFSSYRQVPWLARTHAVSVVPSSTSLLTLRHLPKGSPRRAPMIGFGDPIFSKAQAAQRQPDAPIEVAATTRGVPLARRSSPQLEGVDSADLAQLPRLPDTADELRSIALALEADPAEVLNLGTKANEQMVKSTDLSKYRIIVFATHGLVPGELNGLTQPALALSAPDVSGSEGDGLLTMEEILALKLDADWVVLSACNTATGAGAGAEAASGLGRAFFYAGTRALLVTNWSVYSQSARELTADLFRRQAVDPLLSRGEALRRSMNALIDGPGFPDQHGNTAFSYAHPLFWAPFTIIGDGGAN